MLGAGKQNALAGLTGSRRGMYGELPQPAPPKESIKTPQPAGLPSSRGFPARIT